MENCTLRCPETPIELSELLTEDGDRLVQESGGSLVVGIERRTQKVFDHETICPESTP